MRTRRPPSILVVIVGLALGAGACRDYGEYLSPQVLAACDAGTQTEGCLPPESTEQGVTVAFTAPALQPLTPSEPVSRFLSVAFSVRSQTAMDRVDLTCKGLQLASWRTAPDAQRDAAFSGTIDLLPCRAGSEPLDTTPPTGLRLVHLEVTVTNPLGARSTSAHWKLQVDFRDGTLPLDRDGGVEPVFAVLDFSPKDATARQALTLEVRSDVALAAPPQLEAQGRTFTAEGAPGANGDLRWVVSIPEGLEPGISLAAEGSLAELALPTPIRVTLTGQAEGGATSQSIRTLRLNRGFQHLPDGGLELQDLEWDLGRVDARSPVPLPGGLVVGTYDEAGAATVTIIGGTAAPFAADAGTLPPDAGTASSDAGAGGEDAVQLLPRGSRLLGFNDRGEALILAGSTVQLQERLGSDVFLPLPDFPLPEPGFVSEPVRMGASLCVEQVSAWICDVSSSITLSCAEQKGVQTHGPVEVTAVNGASPGTPALMAVALSGGLLTFGYPGSLLPSGAPCGLPGNQGISHAVAGSRPQGTLGVSIPANPGGELHHLALAAGPTSAVVGFNDTWTAMGLFLRPFDIATGEPGPPYFTDGSTPAPSAPTWGSDVLLARDDGLLLTLVGGSIAGWRPGESAPSVMRLLDQDLAVPASFPPPLRFTGRPHVRHSGDVVTLALDESGGEGRVIVLELDADLTVRWAWRSQPGLAYEAHCGLYGVPDGSAVDLVCWTGNGGPDQIHRIAR